MIFAGVLFLLLATVILASASGSVDSSGSNLKLVTLKHSFKIEDGSTEEEKKYKILLDDTKTKHFFFHLSKEGLLKIEIPKDSSAEALFFYSCNLVKSSSGQPVSLEGIDLKDNNFNFPKGTMIIVIYSASDSSFKGLSPMQLTFPYSKFMGQCGRSAITAFNAQFQNQNVSRGFFLLNPSNEPLDSPFWASIVIVVIFVLDVFFIAGFMFWCYWIKRAEKIKSDK